MTLKQGLNANGEVMRDFYVEHDPVYTDAADSKDNPARTRQEFKDECDINVLMALYERDGIMPPVNPLEPQYFDATDVPDLPRAIEIMNAAEEAFMRLPAKVRKEFDNNAVQFVEFATDPKNLDQMREWGLAPPKPAPVAPAEPAEGVSSPGGTAPKGAAPKSAPAASSGGSAS